MTWGCSVTNLPDLPRAVSAHLSVYPLGYPSKPQGYATHSSQACKGRSTRPCQFGPCFGGSGLLARLNPGTLHPHTSRVPRKLYTAMGT